MFNGYLTIRDIKTLKVIVNKMKKLLNIKGQSATEFVLVLPWICLALIIFVAFTLYMFRVHLANYTGFMAARAYSVWPEEVRISAALAEAKTLLKGMSVDVDIKDEMLNVRSKMPSPFGIFSDGEIVGKTWRFETNTQVVSEPSYFCSEDDNGLLTGRPEACL